MFQKYNRIDTKEKLQQLDSFLMDGDKHRYSLVSLDTETNGLLLYKSAVVGFSISINETQGFYIPLLEWVPDEKSLKKRKVDKVAYESFMNGHFRDVWTGMVYPEFVTPQEYKAPQFIIDYLEIWCSNINLIMHNAPFDVNMIFINMGIDLKDFVIMDTALLAHIINENSPNGLKPTANEYKKELGINPHVMANVEQQELITSIINNGGKKVEVWRANAEYQCKYACADTFLTFGIYRVLLAKFIEQFGEDKVKWLMEDEVMPLCREVVIPMKRKGVYVDVPYFTKVEKETKIKMMEIEDDFIKIITPYLDGFTLGESLDDAISKARLVKRIIKLEGLEIPKKYDKKTDTYKETIAKGEVKKVYQKEPHWIWGYILGEDEIKYSDEKLKKIKQDLYFEIINRRYRFNIQSDYHLRWLFCDSLGIPKSDLPQTDAATKENPIPSMKAEVLIENILPKFPWVSKLLTYKKLMKLHSTYMLPAVSLSMNGFLYMDMRQNGTVSGRFACSGGFNLQTLPRVEEKLNKCNNCKSENIQIIYPIAVLANVICNECNHITENIIRPSAIKKGFIAPPGYKIVNADYSSLEPRCFAHMSNDEKLLDVYKHNLDLYSKVYCDLFDDQNEYSADPKAENFLKKLNNSMRNMIKPVVLGIPYGAQADQVARLTGQVDEKGRALYDQGKLIRDKYLNTYKNLNDYMWDRETECIEQGYVESIVGRQRHFSIAPYVNKHILEKLIPTNLKLIDNILIEQHRELTDKNRRKIMFDAFINCFSRGLRKTSAIVTDRETKITINLLEEDLKALIKHFRMDWAKVIVKGFWAYVRSLAKNEYNNAKNFPIQALAGHITNMGMLKTTRYFKQCGIDAYTCLQIHDEIVVYAEEKIAEDAAIMLQDGMENNIYTSLIDIQMIAEPIIADNLKDAK